jgi:hypothetical protein
MNETNAGGSAEVLLNNKIRKRNSHVFLHGLVGKHFTAGLPS